MNTHKKRSGFKVMTSLIGLVKPMTGYMILAILMGLMGHLCASFITISGGFAILSVLGKIVCIWLLYLQQWQEWRYSELC